MLLEPRKEVYLVDVTTLGPSAFVTSDKNGRNLKAILESSEIIKVFFDIRNDSDALFSLYNISVAGIEDLQLMELASRAFNRRNVNGLARCIERDGTMTYAEKRQWQRVKDRGKDLFDPARGGSYAVFDQRPLSEEMKSYCVQDVTFMPLLRKTYQLRLCDAWRRKIAEETKARILTSQSPKFQGKGRHMAMGPPEWISWNPGNAERKLHTLFDKGALRPNVGPSTSSSTNLDGAILAPGQDDELATLVDRLKLMNEDDKDEPSIGRDNRVSRGSSICDGQIWGTDDEDNDLDYTACDLDCGYCGSCGY
ncbi:3'-5' exonuclease-like protein 3 [Elsinoe australis]|uniref:3'-5' exonuclease-like protein 3 n=1 Tax=Elsinoe australis TaxID=40998 RepID=A0A4U7AT50_9PEZI|nr:3'-5' exonuclease-like protein 3 [Elsinoe australis]